MEDDRVSIVKFGEDLYQTLSHGLNLIDFQVPSDRSILIKPNLCTEIDKTGASTTNIPFIKALINVILKEDRKAAIRIIESNSGMKSVGVAFKNLGYTELVNEFQEQGFDVSLINLSEEPLTTVTQQGLYFKEISLPKILVEPKFLISVAKAKLLSLTTITCVLKNQIGCLARMRFKYHKRLDEVIVDLNDVLRPDLGIVDAIVGQTDSEGGKIIPIGVVVLGRSPASVDSVMAQIMRFNPREIRHLTLAEEQGLGSLNPVVVGESIDDVAVRIRAPHTFMDDLLMAIIRIAPGWFASFLERVFIFFESRTRDSRAQAISNS